MPLILGHFGEKGKMVLQNGFAFFIKKAKRQKALANPDRKRAEAKLDKTSLEMENYSNILISPGGVV